MNNLKKTRRELVEEVLSLHEALKLQEDHDKAQAFEASMIASAMDAILAIDEVSAYHSIQCSSRTCFWIQSLGRSWQIHSHSAARTVSGKSLPAYSELRSDRFDLTRHPKSGDADRSAREWGDLPAGNFHCTIYQRQPSILFCHRP